MNTLFWIIIIILLAKYISTPKLVKNNMGTPKALILTCMDYRFLDDIHKLLEDNGYNENYNQVVLAGSSLGYNQDKFLEWNKTIDKHIELAVQLHRVTQIVVIDHMDCGAYKLLYNNPRMSQEKEYKLHIENLNKIKLILSKTYPKLTVKTFLIDSNGNNKHIK